MEHVTFRITINVLNCAMLTRGTNCL